MSNTKIATMLVSHGGSGKRRWAAPSDRTRWSYGCCFAAETARRGRRRSSAGAFWHILAVAPPVLQTALLGLAEPLLGQIR